MQLTVDYSKAFAGSFSEQEWREQIQKLQSVQVKLQEAKAVKALGFATLPYQTRESLVPLLELADDIRAEFEAVIIVGIGGSDLGSRAVHRALHNQFYNYKNNKPALYFIGDSPDPVNLSEVLGMVDLRTTAIVVISKSGGTVEPTSTFLVLRQKCIEAVGETEAAKHIIMLTDAHGGMLRVLVNQERYRSLAIPSEVGGRFSVLSTVGLFPLAIAGVDIERLLDGARAMDQQDAQANSLALEYAAAQYLAYSRGYDISVFMPYAHSLREVGFWYRQLWAESLGKKAHTNGPIEPVGSTPVAALGPTDQHSQLQLYMEGPANKIITFVKVEQFATDFEVPKAFPELEEITYLGGHSMAAILAAEQESSAQALAEVGRPSVTLKLSEISPTSLGELLYFLEMTVAYMGELLDINAYDQPGVEFSKHYMYRLLGKPGY